MWDYIAIAASSFLCGWICMSRFIHVSQRDFFMRTRTQAVRSHCGWRSSVPRSWTQTIVRAIKDPLIYATLSNSDRDAVVRELEEFLERNPIEQPNHPQPPETVAIVAELAQRTRQ